MLARLKAVVAGALIVAGYFWLGALAKLVLLGHAASGTAGASELHMRPMRGRSPIAVNRQLRDAMAVYGPLALDRTLGPGLAAFLRGVGVGLDPATEEYEGRRRDALERAVRIGFLNPWRNHARLELAAMEAVPASWSPQGLAVMEPEREEPLWVTVALVDRDRWWISRQVSGLDPPRAVRLCEEILADSPASAIAAEALALRAGLAEDRWDFPDQRADLLELILQHPESPVADGVLPQVSFQMVARGHPEDAIPLYRHVMRHRSGAALAPLALQLAPLMAGAGDWQGARAVLRGALKQMERLRVEGETSSADATVERELEKAARALDEPQPAGSRTPAPASGPEAPSGLRAAVRTRLLVDGKPLAGVAAALVPVGMAFQCLPPTLAAEAPAPRAARTQPPPQERGMPAELAWNGVGAAPVLSSRPELIARSGPDGELAWPQVAPGAYAVLLRIGTWQLPGEGRGLAPVPLDAPVLVAGADLVLPELRLAPALPVNPELRGPAGPTLRWESVPSAATYRVALHRGTEFGFSQQVRETGNAALPLDPQVVWWREGVQGTSTLVTPEQFVGPAADRRRNGLQAWGAYTACVEAFAADGRLLAVSEPLVPRARFPGPGWTALRGPGSGGGTPERVVRWDPIAVSATTGADGFGSPFLDLLIRTETAPAPRREQLRVLPTVQSDGQGLPPRASLRIASAAPPASAGPPGTLPVPGMPPGGMPVGPPGAPVPPPGLAGAPPGMAPPPQGPQFASAPPGAPPRLPLAAPPPASLQPGPPGGQPSTLPGSPVSLELLTLRQQEADRWTLDPPGAAFDADSLRLRGANHLNARPAPIPLPVGVRSLGLRTLGGAADARFLLRDGQGKEQGVPAGSALPEGRWSLAGVEIRPRGGEVRLLAITFQSARPGLIGSAVPSESGLELRLWNPGAAPVRATVEAAPGTPLAVLDLAPGGASLLRPPLAAFPGGQPPREITVRWPGGSLLLSPGP